MSGPYTASSKRLPTAPVCRQVPRRLPTCSGTRDNPLAGVERPRCPVLTPTAAQSEYGGAQRTTKDWTTRSAACQVRSQHRAEVAARATRRGNREPCFRDFLAGKVCSLANRPVGDRTGLLRKQYGGAQRRQRIGRLGLRHARSVPHRAEVAARNQRGNREPCFGDFVAGKVCSLANRPADPAVCLPVGHSGRVVADILSDRASAHPEVCSQFTETRWRCPTMTARGRCRRKAAVSTGRALRPGRRCSVPRAPCRVPEFEP